MVFMWGGELEMYKEAGLLPLAVHANLAAAKLRERALRQLL